MLDRFVIGIDDDAGEAYLDDGTIALVLGWYGPDFDEEHDGPVGDDVEALAIEDDRGRIDVVPLADQWIVTLH
jgi:hypothetical protein